MRVWQPLGAAGATRLYLFRLFFRGFLAPAARWPVGLSTVRCTAPMPFLKQARHAHGKHAEAARVLESVVCGRHASVLW